MATVVPIGEFSRLSHLSVKALRHYHDVGVLVPAEVDEHTGYRRYDIAQLPDAHLIRRLRELDMPLEAVRAIVATADQAAREAALADHLDHMERELERTREVVASLRRLLRGPDDHFEIVTRTVAPAKVLMVRSEVDAAEIERWSAATFAQLAEAAAVSGGRPTGESGSLFSDGFFEDGCGEVTAFVVVSAPPDAPTPGCTFGVIDGGRYASSVHCGPYHDLDRTYGRVGGYVAANFDASHGPIREQYLIGPDTTSDPAAFRTEVMWPLR